MIRVIDKHPNLALSRNFLMNQYFVSLHVLLTTLNTKLSFIQEKKEMDEIKSFYVDIVLSKVSGDILQIIAWYAFQDEKLKKSLEESGFFKNIDFKYYTDRNNNIFSNYNFELLLNLHRYDEKIFDNSKKISELRKFYIYSIFFKNGAYIHQYFKDQYSKEIRLHLDGISGKWNLSLTFTQDGLVVKDVDATALLPQTVAYKQMIFDEFKIKIIVDNFFEILLPQGQISEMKIQSNTCNVNKIEII